MNTPPLTTTDADGSNARHAVGVHTVLIREDGYILLGLRSKDVNLAPNKWSTICGNLETGESAVDGAVREVAEEIGVVIDPRDMQFATVTHFVNDEGHGPAFAMFFTATKWTGEPRVMEPDKCDVLGWFSPDELPDPMVPYVASALHDVRHGRDTGSLGFGFGVFGWDELPDDAPPALMPRGHYIARLPKVVTAATMLFTDTAGRVLLVDQTYRDDGIWSWPGGGGELNEPPRQTARREILEELGLVIEPGAMLTVNWNRATDHPPLINYLYDGGTLTDEQIAAITHDDEIAGYAFLDPADAARRLSVSAQGELTAALAAKEQGTCAVELEDGQCAVHHDIPYRATHNPVAVETAAVSRTTDEPEAESAHPGM